MRASTARLAPSAPAQRRPVRSRRARRRMRTRCRTTRMRTRRMPRTPRMQRIPRTPRTCTRITRPTHHACAPRRRRDELALMAAGPPSRRASAAAAAAVRARSTSAPTAWCSRTTREMSPPSSTNTSPKHSPSINRKRVSRWRLATCPRRSSTRRRPAPRAPVSTCTTTTRGISTMLGTGTRRTGTRRSTTRRRRTTTWRRPATAGCCWAAARCTRSTSPWSGPTRTRTTRTRSTSTRPPARPTPTRRPVWRRRCRTRLKTCTGSERDAAATDCDQPSKALDALRDNFVRVWSQIAAAGCDKSKVFETTCAKVRLTD